MPNTFPFAKKSTYYRRFRSLPLVITTEDGITRISAEPIDALTTRWGYQPTRYRRAKDAYYSPTLHLWLTIACHVPTSYNEGGTPASYAHCFTPLMRGTLSDRYPAHTLERGDVPPCRVEVRTGRTDRIIQLDDKGRTLAVIGTAADGIEWCEDLLSLNVTKRTSPRNAA